MSLSKAWNWELSKDSFWDSPCWEYYYILNRWKNNQFEQVLDLGCGKGRHAIDFAKNGFNVNACDLSDFALNYLSKKIDGLNIKLSKCDIINLPYSDNSFDCLFAYHVISHTNSEGIVKILKEIDRVLKPNGEIFIDFISKEAHMFQCGKHPIIDENSVIMSTPGEEYGIPHFFVNYQELLNLLQDFEIINIDKKETYSLNPNITLGIHYYVLARSKK